MADPAGIRPVLKPSGWILLVLLLIPALVQVWRQSDLPRFGDFHDDTVYYVTAKSLAAGDGYRIKSLPGEPVQGKYPPLYPLLLSLAWRIDPQFPHNLSAAAWISWLSLPVVLFQLPFLFRRWGFSPGRTWLLLTLFAVNPYTALFSTQLLSEMLFLALVLASMLLLERSLDHGAPSYLPAVAGMAGGLVCLTRSAGIALLAAGVAYLWIRKRRQGALLFAAGMIPFILGWVLWSRLNQTPVNDPSMVYYTDYFRNQLNTLVWSDLHVYLWKNLDSLLWGLGGLIVPKVTGSWLLKILAQVLAVAMIAGIVRMVRQGHALLYALFAAFGAVLLLACAFPSNERLVLPWFPLALAGLVTEMAHFWGLLRAGLRHQDHSQRVLAGGLMAIVSTVFCFALGLELYVGQVFMPRDAEQHRTRRASQMAAYQWAAANVPAGASFLSSDDGIVYLYTGHHAMSAILPTQLWYRDDRDGIVNWFTGLQPFARDHGLEYFEFAGADPGQGIDDEAAARIEQKIRTHPDLDPLYSTSAAALYKFR